jgi:hypothetical protein
MSSDNRFMNEVFRIITGALRLDTDKVRNYTAFLADKLEASGDVSSANKLRKLLSETDNQLYPVNLSTTRAIPVDTETRFPLLEKVNVKTKEQPMVLSDEQWSIVNEFLSVSKSFSQMEEHNLGNSLTMIMYGPPGTGKNRLARYIASDLGYELYIARLDGLISSYLGSTSKNIRALFDFAAKTPCILFLDEFDAIAKLRGDNQEMGELKRVVNSFIQNLDSLGGHSIVLAATNHPELLDVAIWRRFSYRVPLSFPDSLMREKLWKAFLHPLEFNQKEIELLVDLSDGFSGSDIQEVCIRLNRRKVITKEIPGFKDAFLILKNLAVGDDNNQKFLSKFQNKDDQTITRTLRKRNPKLYSHASVADLFGVSKATAHRWSK